MKLDGTHGLVTGASGGIGHALAAIPYWKQHYVVTVNPDHIEEKLAIERFTSAGRDHELLTFAVGRGAPNVLISPGTAGHAYVFAELGYLIHRRGFNVSILPKHGSATINELVERHRDVALHVARTRGGTVGLYGEGLGGYASFYLALANGPIHSLICENSPAVLTEPEFHSALLKGGGAARRRRRLLSAVELVARVAPWLKIPTRLYLDFAELVDPQEPAHSVEERIVGAYGRDPDFDRRYTLSAILSLLTTPPPAPLAELRVPTMFLVAERGFVPEYVRRLYDRLPTTRKRLIEIDGSVFWMVSHPNEASDIISGWFEETLGDARKPRQWAESFR